MTADAGTDLASSRARLVPGDVRRHTAAGMVATLDVPATGLVAGREEKLALHVHDAATGAPVTDLEPYLGAHGHALEPFVPGGVEAGGPDLTFKALLPKPGRYRIWAQVKRAGVVSTLPFTVEASSPAALSGGR